MQRPRWVIPCGTLIVPAVPCRVGKIACTGVNNALRLRAIPGRAGDRFCPRGEHAGPNRVGTAREDSENAETPEVRAFAHPTEHAREIYGSGEVSNEVACTAMVPIRVGTMRRKGASTFVPAICAKEISMSRRSATYFVIMLLAR